MRELLKKFLLDYLHSTGAIDYFPGIGDEEIAETIPDSCVANFEKKLRGPVHEGHPKDHPQFFKPLVDHEIGLSIGGAAKITGRQVCWEIEVDGMRAMVYLDAECRLQATPLPDGREINPRELRGFIAGELDALVISLTRFQ
jgi:hypothetical protein